MRRKINLNIQFMIIASLNVDTKPGVSIGESNGLNSGLGIGANLNGIGSQIGE